MTRFWASCHCWSCPGLTCWGFSGWSGREGDRPGGVAAGCLGECLGGIGEVVAGGDRDLQPVSELLREVAQLVSVTCISRLQIAGHAARRLRVTPHEICR